MVKARKLTVKETARILGTRDSYVRYGLQQQRLPFGTAVKVSPKRWTYNIIESKVYEYINEKEEETNEENN